MGFMDKAKQMAEQAQQKIEETQKQFNDNQAQKAGSPVGGGGVRYDEHGRPIQDASDPATAEGVAMPQPPEGAEAPVTEAAEPEEKPVPPPAPPKDGMNATPDPFKPIQ